MSNYAIMRFQKYKLGSVANIERHQNHRDRLKHRMHPERESQNITWVKDKDKTMTQVIREVIRNQQEQSKKKVRKDAVALVEFVLTFSPEMEEFININEWNKANLRWLSDNFGVNNIIRFDINCDESTKHGHYFVCPKDEQDYLNAKKYFGKKEQIKELQNTYAKAMEKFGLIRGINKDISRAKHKTLDEWHKEETKKLESIKRQIFDVPIEKEKTVRLGDELFNELL